MWEADYGDEEMKTGNDSTCSGDGAATDVMSLVMQLRVTVAAAVADVDVC